MGDKLNVQEIRAFCDEMVKLSGFSAFRAGSRMLGKDLRRLGNRLRNPVQGFREGWQATSPVGLLRGAAGAEEATALREAIAKTRDAATKKGFLGALQRTFGAGTHLDPKAVKGSGIKGIAEELSRQGMTGQGRVTKYIPIGERGQLVLGGLSGAQGAREALKSGPTEEGGAYEQLGRSVGFVLPGIMSAGLPVSGLVAPLLTSGAFASVGQKLDDLRGGGGHSVRPPYRVSPNKSINAQTLRRADRLVDRFARETGGGV